LIVIVPYGAFRSLATEMEDRTYELLSITTLSARQVITGKLASAVLQMLVYLSAVLPCLGFTFLLRGIDLVTILMIVAYTVAASLGLSTLALLMATESKERYRQVLLNVQVVVGLFLAFWGASALCWIILDDEPLPVADPEFWIVNAALATAYVSYLALFLLTAAAQLNFASSNRSTSIRYVMVLQFAAFAGWIGWTLFSVSFFPEILLALLVVTGLHWYAMGVFLTGEPAELSPRVLRQLPHSLLGRVFHTWFNPGPATGYVLALGGYLAAIVLAALFVAARPALGIAAAGPPWAVWNASVSERLSYTAVLGFSYLAFYLGLGKLLLGWLARFRPTAPIVRLPVHLVLLLAGTLGPLFTHLSASGFRRIEYSPLEATNPFWTLATVLDGRLPPSIGLSVLIMAVLAGAVVLANFPSVLREVRRVRAAVPPRIATDDVALAAACAPAAPARAHPWDE
jgi:hypothetical protein